MNRFQFVADHRDTFELNDGATLEERVSHKRVARVMREHRLPGPRQLPPFVICSTVCSARITRTPVRPVRRLSGIGEPRPRQ